MYAEVFTSGIREENLPVSVSSLRFSQPRFQYSRCGFGERGATFFTALSNHAYMSTSPKYDVLAFESSHFRQAQTGLYGYKKKRVIATAEPGERIRCGEQGINFWTREKVHQSACEALAGDRKHPLDLGGLSWCLESCITKEGADRG
jgi:hypothetical protein